jgi:LytTr DNA-binding domain
MLDALRRPVALSALIALTVGAAAAVALYCIAYSALAGRSETLQESLLWALINICPWLPAIEAAKRADNWSGASGALLLGLALSLLLGLLAGATDLWFEAIRRVPAFAAALAAVALLRSRIARPGAGAEMPLLPRQIDWVRAAGNYIELRASGRTIVHRSSIGAAERDLAEHGFVRIHRSTLVRRDRIARVRPQDVVLIDGTHLKLGKRYRASLH